MPEPVPAGRFRIRSLGLPIYLPTLLFSIGQGAVIPFTPLHAMDLGASVASASLIVALRGVGMMIFDIPAGLLVTAIGERRAMFAGTALLGCVAVGTAATTSPFVFGGLMVVMGFSWSIWLLARLAYVSDVASPDMRGRALSLIGGTNRMGMFIGPLAGGLVAREFGLASTFYVQAALAAAASAVLLVATLDGRETSRDAHAARQGFAAILAAHRHVFATAGVVVVCLAALRAARQTVLPLWGDAIGLGPAMVGAVYGASSGLDALLFYPAGAMMDRRGRKPVAILCLVTLGGSLMLVPAAHTASLFVLVALLSGLGNGFGTGIVMTLGADFSPPGRRAEFLGVWRLMSDMGLVGGPLLLSVLTGAFGLGLAAAATGGIGLLGAALMWRVVPETRPAEPDARSVVATGPGDTDAPR